MNRKMRIAFWIFGLLFIIGGLYIEYDAISVMHQQLGLLHFVIASILIVGAEVIAAIINHTDSQLAQVAEKDPIINSQLAQVAEKDPIIKGRKQCRQCGDIYAESYIRCPNCE